MIRLPSCVAWHNSSTEADPARHGVGKPGIMADHDFEFEFERDLQNDFREQQSRPPPQMPVGEIGQQPRNFVRNYKKVSNSESNFLALSTWAFCVFLLHWGAEIFVIMTVCLLADRLCILDQGHVHER